MFTSLLFLCLNAQTDISAQISPRDVNKKLTIGDPFELLVTVKYPAGTNISEPFFDSLKPFVLLNMTSKTVQEKGTVQNRYQLRLAAFNTGELNVPPLLFLVRRDSITDTIKTSPVPLKISSVLTPEQNDINDIKEAIQFPNLFPLYLLALVIIASGLAAAVYFIIKKYRKAKESLVPPIPPWIEAITAIDNTPWHEWADKGLVKKYYYTLSEIIKRYIERRFEFNAVEQTTTEIIHNLKLRKVTIRDDYDAFFSRADLVKYAKLVPPKEELNNAVAFAKELVNKTKIVASGLTAAP